MAPQMLFLAAMLAAGAVGPQQPTSVPRTPSSNAPGDRLATPAPAKVVVEGCVANEAEVRSRKADLGERTGLDKHFVLVDGAVVKGKAPVAAPAGSGSGVVSKALPPMFRLHGLTDEQLKLHVGYRVRVDGHFADLDAPTTSAGSEKDLALLDVATIRQVPGDCSVPKS